MNFFYRKGNFLCYSVFYTKVLTVRKRKKWSSVLSRALFFLEGSAFFCGLLCGNFLFLFVFVKGSAFFLVFFVLASFCFFLSLSRQLEGNVEESNHPIAKCPRPFQKVEEKCLTNRKNKGLISTDRGTRPLSCVQYPVLHLSHIQRICLSRYLNLFFSIR
jgi:hypothetical protein